jgi:hypothetical protein
MVSVLFGGLISSTVLCAHKTVELTENTKWKVQQDATT